MTISGSEALRQATDTAHDYASNAVRNLCDVLDIDRREPDWRDQLAPFAAVLAAMVSASAADYDTAMRGGVIDSAKPVLTVTHEPIEAEVTVRRGYSEAECNSWYVEASQQPSE